MQQSFGDKRMGVASYERKENYMEKLRQGVGALDEPVRAVALGDEGRSKKCRRWHILGYILQIIKEVECVSCQR